MRYLRRGADERLIFYAGFRLEGEDKDAPLRLFVERNAPAPEALTTLQAFLPEQTGYLVENGLPDEALAELRARGVEVASPHWVLKTGDLARREPFYIAAALGGFVGLVCLLVGFAGLSAGAPSRLAGDRDPSGRDAGGLAGLARSGSRSPASRRGWDRGGRGRPSLRPASGRRRDNPRPSRNGAASA